MTRLGSSSGGTERISPTAHYTGQTWLHHGLSDPALGTSTGRALFYGLAPAQTILSTFGAPTIDGFLLARHQAIDSLLRDAIEDGSVSQVVELACGLSPRGLRFSRHYGERITYVEADLTDMARLKSDRLERAGLVSTTHRVTTVDVLAEDGSECIADVLESLDLDRGTAVITEGLMNYFAQPQAEQVFSRIAAGLSRFPSGLFLSDLFLAGENNNPIAKAFEFCLGVFVRGSVHLYYDDENTVVSAMIESGFTYASAERAVDVLAGTDLRIDPASKLVRIVRATL